MIHHGQSLAFCFESGDDLTCIHTEFDDFQGD